MNNTDTTQTTGKVMIFATWILLILGLTFFFHQWLSDRDNPNRHIAASIGAQGNTQVVLERSRSGHFISNGHINGHAVTFLIDTGASDVNIPAKVAKRLGLSAGQPFNATTANGMITVYATQLDSIGIDKLRLHNIRASINPHMHTEEILLGMSFLQHLELNQKGRLLTLSVPQ